MTTARLKGAPGEGHGLTELLTDPAYEAVANHGKKEDIVVVAILRPDSANARDTAQGGHRSVTFEAVRLEPVRDPHMADELRTMVSDLYRARTTPQSTSLPLEFDGFKAAEQRKTLVEAITEWAKSLDLTPQEITDRWRTHFDEDSGVSQNWKRGTVEHLREFALESGAIEQPVPGDEPDHETKENPGKDPDEDGGDDESPLETKEASAGPGPGPAGNPFEQPVGKGNLTSV